MSTQLGLVKPKGLPNAAVDQIVQLQNRVRSAEMSATASGKSRARMFTEKQLRQVFKEKADAES